MDLNGENKISILRCASIMNITNCAFDVKTRRYCGKVEMQMGGCANDTERLFPLCNLYLVSFFYPCVVSFL